MTAPSLDVLVVIPCLNEAENIAAVIRSVLADAAHQTFLIVVADGGSSDGTQDIVRGLAATEAGNLRLIDNPARTQSAGVNRAVALFGAGKWWLARLDAHAAYPAGYVTCLIGEARRTGAASVVVGMDASGEGLFQKAVALAQNTILGSGGAAHRWNNGLERFVDHGHHALFDMRMFQSLHGYDETQSHNEDAEFDVRLQKAGGRIWLTRAVSVKYFPRSTPRDLYRQYRNYGKGRALTILRHRRHPKLRQLLPAAVAPALALGLAAFWYPPLAIPALLWSAVCLVSGVALALRSRCSHALLSGPAAMIMHLAWSIGFWRGLMTGSKFPRRAIAPDLP